jgi:hypothetical protein
MKIVKFSTTKTTTYDAVETAIELSKDSRLTWEELIRKRGKGITPWITDVTVSDDPQRLSRTEQDSQLPQP